MPVFVGGHHASLSPEDFYSPCIDGVVIGEGEMAIRRRRFEALGAGRICRRSRDWHLNEPSGPVYSPERPLSDNLDDLPIPARHLHEKLPQALPLGVPEALLHHGNGPGMPLPLRFLQRVEVLPAASAA